MSVSVQRHWHDHKVFMDTSLARTRSVGSFVVLDALQQVNAMLRPRTPADGG